MNRISSKLLKENRIKEGTDVIVKQSNLYLDTSGSTHGSTEYYTSTKRILEDKTFDKMYEWAGTCEEISKEELDYCITQTRNKKCDPNSTLPSTFIKHIENNQNALIITDGKFSTKQDVEKAIEELKKLKNVSFKIYVENSNDPSLALPFLILGNIQIFVRGELAGEIEDDLEQSAAEVTKFFDKLDMAKFIENEAYRNKMMLILRGLTFMNAEMVKFALDSIKKKKMEFTSSQENQQSNRVQIGKFIREGKVEEALGMCKEVKNYSTSTESWFGKLISIVSSYNNYNQLLCDKIAPVVVAQQLEKVEAEDDGDFVLVGHEDVPNQAEAQPRVFVDFKEGSAHLLAGLDKSFFKQICLNPLLVIDFKDKLNATFKLNKSETTSLFLTLGTRVEDIKYTNYVMFKVNIFVFVYMTYKST